MDIVHAIYLPPQLNLKSAIAFGNELKTIPEADCYAFDFSQVGHAEPLAMILFGLHIQNFINRNKDFSDIIPKNQNNNYAGHMGFYRFCGFDYGKKPGQAKGSSTYLPITTVQIRDIHLETEGIVPVGKIVENRASSLAGVLCQSGSTTLLESVSYSIKEIMRNCAEHSKGKTIYYAAQYWPKYNKVEIAIVDDGVGVRSTLSHNPNLKLENDLAALKKAILPSISSVAFNGKTNDSAGDFAHSGFGLYMTSRMCEDAGYFHIMSGEAALSLSRTHTIQQDVPNFKGTAVRIIFDTTKITALDENLRRYSNEAKEIAKSMNITDYSEPSRASMTPPKKAIQ